jgi:hypothetical protein
VDYGYLYTYWEAWDESGVDYCMYRLNGGDWVLADTDGYWYGTTTTHPGGRKLHDGDQGVGPLGNAASVFINFTAQSDTTCSQVLLARACRSVPGPLSLSSEAGLDPVVR